MLPVEGILEKGAIARTTIDGGLCDGSGLVIVRFKVRVRRDMAEVHQQDR